MQIAVPFVRAVGVARETGFVAVSRGENLEVRVAKSEGLEARDIKELPPALSSAFLGYRYFEPEKVSLSLDLMRHEVEPVLGALIRRMHIDTVLTDQGEATHEAIFEVQNNREQYLVLKVPGNMEIWGAFVRGVPVRPTTRESDGARLIELTKSESKDDAFRVRLVMHEKLPGGVMAGRVISRSGRPSRSTCLFFASRGSSTCRATTAMCSSADPCSPRPAIPGHGWSRQPTSC